LKRSRRAKNGNSNINSSGCDTGYRGFYVFKFIGDDHIGYGTYEFEPNKKGLIDAMQTGLGLVSDMSIGDTDE